MSVAPCCESSEEEISALKRFPPYRVCGALERFLETKTVREHYPLSFLHPGFSSHEAWRAQGAAALEEAMQRPRELRLTGFECRGRQTISKSWGSYEREEWLLHSSGGYTIPATILKPSGARPPLPAVIALHDMSGMRVFGREKLFPFEGEPAYLTQARLESYESAALGESLVRRGILVIGIDAWGFGERIADWSGFENILTDRMHFNAAEAKAATFGIIDQEWAAVRGAFLAGTTWAGLIAQDDLLTLDFLLSRKEVDPLRIGCTGLSFGAFRANYLAALDTRIRATVSVCWHSTLAGIMGYNLQGAIGSFALLPGLYQKMDLCDIASLAAPRSFLAISGAQDRLMQPSGAAAAHQKLRRIWEKAGAAGNFDSLFFDAGHQYGRAAQGAALAWFEDHLISAAIPPALNGASVA